MDKIKRFFKEEDGLELSEYAVMAALLLAIAVTAVSNLGEEIETIFGRLLTLLQGV